MIWCYYVLVSVGFILVLPWVPFIWLLSGKRRANLLQRLGWCTGIKKTPGPRQPVWIHALSVGEVISAVPLVLAVSRQFPETPVVFTASTRTGYDTARRLFCRTDSPLVSQIAYFPFDLPWAVARVRHQIDPAWVCLVETDLWPGFLHAMARKKIPVVLVNARLSDRSFRGYRRLGPARALFFSQLTHVGVQTRQDLSRFKALGIPESRLTLAGNIKFDQPLETLTDTERNTLEKWFHITDSDRVWMAGSTHPGEERLLWRVFQQVREQVPGLKLIIAPRDPARCRQVAREISQNGGESVFLSAVQNQPQDAPVMLLDCLGVLAKAYAVCDVAFIGGSLVPCGGHNPLEPAMFRKPVLFGPHMEDFAEVADLLLARAGACKVTDAGSLSRHLKDLLTCPERAADMGQQALTVYRENTGAVDRTLALLTRLQLRNRHV
ncbi:MAG: 3-deoxy-D-manno-octulosonic acid transferase [Desulfotignum sp.]|nr:3-deoxy-D-manno-octulosonic acid transferase [Desulfotignum sp.]